jgi:hypothetical protein
MKGPYSQHLAIASYTLLLTLFFQLRRPAASLADLATATATAAGAKEGLTNEVHEA